MCGIIGYTGHRPAVPLLLEGLHRLEYRGYDSAGLAFIQNNRLQVVRSSGKLDQLEAKLASMNRLQATAGLGHTRWATHGLPTEQNAHPHCDHADRVALVHNGIIENFAILRRELEDAGVCFRSETDTEVLVHCIAGELDKDQDMLGAISRTLSRVEGSYALAVVHLDEPGTVYAARHSSPLLLGTGTGENFVASDIPAFLPYTREVVFLEDGELVRLKANSWAVFDAATLEPLDKRPSTITWDIQSAQKAGYKHFMIKEIMDQPQVILDCMAGRVDADGEKVVLKEIQDLPVPEHLHIVACGTSYHAGLWARPLFEEWVGIPVQVEIASEFRYRRHVLRPGDLALAISQSGETADTLAGMRLIREHSVPVVGLCNVVGSSVAREADRVVYTQAGPEISVASTKAMCSQMVALLLLALHWGDRKGTLPPGVLSSAVRQLLVLPGILKAELPGLKNRAFELSRKYSDARSFFFLGRGLFFPLALEGALKLKEISYIHAEGYAAGEMKHGPIALIDPDFPTFALAPGDPLLPKVVSNLREVQARGGRIIALTTPGTNIPVDDLWEVPEMWGALNSFLALPALQLFAYEMAVFLGKDVDQPRNLAKSVTVE
ncbi:MAG: glutamine--fructose-6-phosphate transaminase (isomerizing) [Desulfohalobiaceae bacterium]